MIPTVVCKGSLHPGYSLFPPTDKNCQKQHRHRDVPICSLFQYTHFISILKCVSRLSQALQLLDNQYSDIRNTIDNVSTIRFDLMNILWIIFTSWITTFSFLTIYCCYIMCLFFLFSLQNEFPQ